MKILIFLFHIFLLSITFIFLNLLYIPRSCKFFGLSARNPNCKRTCVAVPIQECWIFAGASTVVIGLRFGLDHRLAQFAKPSQICIDNIRMRWHAAICLRTLRFFCCVHIGIILTIRRWFRANKVLFYKFFSIDRYSSIPRLSFSSKIIK